MANESFTREIFVGRELERNEFHQFLHQCPGCQILHLQANGGAGKTRLLEWIVAETQRLNKILEGDKVEPGSEDLALIANTLRGQNLQSIRVTKNLVDFYKTEIHTPLGLMNNIAIELQLEKFLEYSKKFEAKGIENPNQWKELQTQFLREYRELAQDTMVVLLFDTFEDAGPAGESLLTELLPELGPNTLVVIAGREQVIFPKNLQVQKASLTPLADEDAIAFFRQRDLTDNVVTDKQIKQINTMVEGRPIYLALAIDWLVNAKGTAQKLVQPNPPEDLGQALVKHILNLQDPENTAILYLAQIWRWGEPGLLAHLLNITEAEAAHLAENLGRYSFIKYRKPDGDFNGSCLLHDEMRHLVKEYCWPDYDKTGDTRKALTRLALEYYEGILRERGGGEIAQGQRRAKDPVLRNYQAEWLYYQLQLKLEEGIQKMDPLFRDAAHQRDMAFCQELLDELKRPEFWKKLPPAEQAAGDFRQGLILYRNEKYTAAEESWVRITGPTAPNPKYRATALMLLAELYGDLGRTEEGLKCAQQAQEAYTALLEKDPENRVLKRERGELYNNWGRLVRLQDNFPLAIDFYQRALSIYKDFPVEEVNKARARTLNNLGYVYYLLGDMIQAKLLCGRSIKIRETLDIKYELGLGYNTMGMVLEAAGNTGEAASMYTKALAAFGEVPSIYGRGLVMINHGRIHRNTDEFAEAFEALGEAETIFRRLDNKGYLAETLNELGSVYRERGSQEDMAQAEKYFRESILSSGDNRKVDNLTDMAMMFAQAGKAQETQTCLAEAEPLIVKLRDIYYRGQTHEIRANLYFAEGEGLQDKQPKQAHKRFQQAFDASLDAALAYVECMRKPFQFHRAERRYRHVLDLIQRKLDICPRADISSHTERLTKRWRAQNFEDKYNDLLKTLEIITNDIDY